MSVPLDATRNHDLDRLRRQIAAMSGRPDRAAVEVSDPSDDVLPVPAPMADLLPRGGVTRGSVSTVAGARSALLAVIASVSGAGRQVGLVGMPQLNLGAVAELGGDLTRIATVPDPGADPVEVAGILLDGMDLVVLDLGGAQVPPSRTRVMMGRLRKQMSALMITGGAWPGAQLRLDTEIVTYRHLPGTDATDLAVARRGVGRIGGMTLRMTVTDRGHRRAVGEIDLLTSGFGPDRRVEMVTSSLRPRLAVAN
ncbi:hypothetical protein VZC37_00885 [Gordonia sp. LSe1-13]|uniref:Uncharacterized protein n=1 Tax=Gordonia sesuvii TaxID=3116777 RepID=A0ABU7M6Y7_9ACTN|nr:hypothetical protein [Gordonia sp. LSe1-13]